MYSYQEVTGSLLASGYNKLGTQEAMNDMYVTEMHREWSARPTVPTGQRGSVELYARPTDYFEGGG